MRRFLLLALTLALAACAPQPQGPGAGASDQPPAAPTAPRAPQLKIIPHPLLAALPDRVGDEDAVALRPASGGVTIRIHLADGSYSPGWGGQQGQVLPPQGTGIGPLNPGTVIEVLDGNQWAEVARYQ